MTETWKPPIPNVEPAPGYGPTEIHHYSPRPGLDWCRFCGEVENHRLHIGGKAQMHLVQITDKLWINPTRVLSVEERTIDNGRGTHTFVEVTMETCIRWKLDDIPLTDVVEALQT